MNTTPRENTGTLPSRFSEPALDSLLAQLPRVGLCVLDIRGSIVYWHASAQHLLGHIPEHVRGQRLETFLPEERRTQAVLQRALFEATAQECCALEAALITRAGQRLVCTLDLRVHLNEHGDPAGFVVLIRAGEGASVAANQASAEQALAVAHRSNLARLALEPAWIGIDLAGRITQLSDTGAQRIGQQADTIAGCPIADSVRPANAPDWSVLLYRCVRADTALAIELTPVNNDDNASEPVSAQLLPLFDGAARIQGFTLVLVPIASAPARGASDDIDHGWLMSAAHDLREPMRKMQHYAAQLQTAEAPRMSEQGRRHLDSIQSASERMQSMVGGVFRLARVAAGQTERVEVELTRLIDDVRSDLAMLIDENSARFDIDDLGTLAGDPAQLRALFQNLIDNSIRYRRQGIAPEIRIRRVEEPDRPDAIALDYIDNGRGIHSTQDAFSPFRSHASGERGTGLGLPLCRRICRRHQGDIRVEHTGAEGTCFRIILSELDPGAFVGQD